MDADFHIHAVAIMHLLAPENIFGYTLFHAHSLAAYARPASTVSGEVKTSTAAGSSNDRGSDMQPTSTSTMSDVDHPLLAKARVLADGNVAIETSTASARPDTRFQRIRHLKADFRSNRNARHVFEK